MEPTTINLSRSICSLFQVIQDEAKVQRVVTPLEYPGSGDKVVIRVRPQNDGYQIDENGEAAFYAAMAGGDVDSENVSRWAAELLTISPVAFGDDDRLAALAPSGAHVAPYIIRVAEAAQQLYALATSRSERRASDFKERLAEIIWGASRSLKLEVSSNVTLPIAGGLEADYVIEAAKPLIIVAANSTMRLLEAEVICMQYRTEKKPGRVIAIVESQNAVGKKQFERAGYYTDRTVVFNENSIESLISLEIMTSQ